MSQKTYGGLIYENEIIEQLKGKVYFERIYLLKHKIKILNLYRFFWFFFKYRYLYDGELFLNDKTTFLAGKRAKNYIIIHHLDSSFSPKLSILMQKYAHYWLEKNKNIYHSIICVSEYWKIFLEKRNFKNVNVIYNAFNLTHYQISFSEQNDFLEKYNLGDKPIIYIGNAQSKKGTLESYNSLKELDVYLVSSGRAMVEIPCLNLDLSHKEYLVLLSLSRVVVTMSKFSEGWNRTAHEAILLNTPVIGSGMGGMKELLHKSNQTVCKSFENLLESTRALLSSEPNVCQSFVNKLDLNYFNNEWSRVFINNEK